MKVHLLGSGDDMIFHTHEKVVEHLGMTASEDYTNKVLRWLDDETENASLIIPNGEYTDQWTKVSS